MNINKYTGNILTGIVCAGVTFGICWYYMDYSRRDIIETGEEYIVISECENILKNKNYPLGKNEMSLMNAVNGYFSDCTDKYTYYYEDNETAQATSYFNDSGTSLASGFKIDKDKSGYIVVTEVDEDSAAEIQGLRVNDLITAIDGEEVLETGYENITNELLGKDGTVMHLQIKRNEESLSIDFERRHVYLNDVNSEIIGKVGYVKIDSFHQMMQGQFGEALKDVENCNKLIFDLRNNPGGDGDVVMTLASVIAGDVTVTKHYYTGENEVKESENPDSYTDKDIVVLVNNGTASAAEIFTALLKQNIDVCIVGETTHGKGTFQEEAELSSGGKLHYTAGYYTVGDWECYDGVGIKPDIEIEMDSELIGTDNDIQLQKALEILS